MAVSIQIINNDVATTLYPSEEIPVRMDLQTITNGEIGDVFGSFSQTFTIPRDNTSISFFEHGDEIADVGEIPGFFSDLEATIYNDDDVVTTGLFSLESINVEDGKYNCSFAGHDTQFFALLDGRLVVESDWTDLAHEYDQHAPFKSWTTPAYAAAATNENTCRSWYIPDQDITSGEYAAVVYTDCNGEGQTKVISSTTGGFNISTASGSRPTLISNTSSTGTGGYPATLQNIELQGANAGVTNLSGVLANGGDPIANGDVFYPLIDQGYDGAKDESEFGFITTADRTSSKGSWKATQTPMTINQLTPAIRLSQVFKKAFDEVGKRYSSDFIDNALNDCYIMPKAYEGLGIVGQDKTTNGFRTGVQTTSFTHRITGTAATNETQVRGSTIIGDTSGVGDYADGIYTSRIGTDGKFTVPTSGTYEFYFTFEITQVSDNLRRPQWQRWEWDIVTDNASAETEGDPVSFKIVGKHPADQHLGYYTVKRKFNLDADDKVWVRMRSKGNKGAKWVRVQIDNYEFGTDKEPQVWEEVECNPGDQFPPDLEWTELIGKLIQQFNLIIYPDGTDRDLYHISPYYNWINEGKLVDWTDRVDLDKGITKTPVVSDQPRRLSFEMAEDDDVYNSQAQEKAPRRPLGSTENLVNIESSKLSGDKEIGGFFGGFGLNRVLGDLLNETETNFNETILHLWEKDGQDKSTIEWSPRIGFKSRTKELPFTAYISHSTDTTQRREISTYTTLVPVSPNTGFSTHWDLSPDFPTAPYPEATSAYDWFWKRYIDNLYDDSNYKIECDVFLRPSDFDDLKANNIFLINGEKFTFNRISGFNVSEPDIVTVEMIKFYDNYDRLTEAVAKQEPPEPPAPKPMVVITADKVTPALNETVTFTATLTNFENEDSLNISWYAQDASGTAVTLTDVSGNDLQKTLSRSVAGSVTVFINVNDATQEANDELTVSWVNSIQPPTVSLSVTGATLQPSGRYRATPNTTITVAATVTNFTGTTVWNYAPQTGVTAGGSGNTRTYVRSSDGYTAVQASVSNDNGSDVDSVVLEWEAVVSNTAPQVLTVNSTGERANSFQMNGYLTSNGGANVTDQGFYIVAGTDATQSAVLAGTKVALGASDRNIVGPFSLSTATNLTADTDYSFMAYATNSVGTSYGQIITASTEEAGERNLLWNPSSLTFGQSGSSKNSLLVNENIIGTFTISRLQPITGDFSEWATIERVGNTFTYKVTTKDIASTQPISKRVGYFRATHVETGLTADLYITQNNALTSNTITVANESGFASYGRAAGVDGLVVTTNPHWVRWIANIEYHEGDGWARLSADRAFGTHTTTLTLTRNSTTAPRTATITFTATDTDWNPLTLADGSTITATFSLVQTAFERVLFDVYCLDSDGRRLSSPTVQAEPSGAVARSSDSRNIEVAIAPSTATWTATRTGVFGTPSNGSWLTINTASGTGAAEITWTASRNTGSGARLARIDFVGTTGTDTKRRTVYVNQQSGQNGSYLPGGSGLSVPQFGTPTSASVTSSAATVSCQWYNGGEDNSSHSLYYGTQTTKSELRTNGTKVTVSPNATGVLSRSLSSLSASTTYRFFFDSVNTRGTGESTIGSFTTASSNSAPTAAITGGTSVNTNTALALSGTGSSDTDGSISTYAWTSSPSTGVTFSAPSGSTTNFTATTAGSYTVTLTVTDDDGASDTDTHTITVTTPVTFSFGEDSVDLANTNDATGTSSVTQTGTGTVTFSGVPSWLDTPTLNGAGTQVTFTTNDANNSSGDTSRSATITATKGTATDTITVTQAGATNVLPTVSIGGAATKEVAVNTAQALSATASDSDGSISTYAWTSSPSTNVTFSAASASSTNFTASATGTYTVTITVTDNSGGTATATNTIEVDSAAITPSSVTIGSGNDATATAAFTAAGPNTNALSDNQTWLDTPTISGSNISLQTAGVNTTGSSRSATVTLTRGGASDTVTVTQSAATKTCRTYSAQNTSGSTQTLNYTSCNGTASTLSVNLFATVSVPCADTATAPSGTSITVTQSTTCSVLGAHV